MDIAGPCVLVIDHGDHTSETQHQSRAETLGYLRAAYLIDSAESGTGQTPTQLDALKPEEFLSVLADYGWRITITEPN